MTAFFKLIRAHQWIKNFFVFAPLFFSGQFAEQNKLLNSTIGFLLFCITASSIYILNDIIDVEKDRLHPEKKSRPLASGAISKSSARILFFIFASVSLVFSFFFNFSFFVVTLVYFSLNVLYSFGLKTVSLVDIFIVSSGFVLRVIAGGVIASIEVSHWLFIMTFLLALFLAFAKRYDDVVIEKETGVQMRNSISGYNVEFIAASVSILCGVLIVAYIIYITSAEITERFANKHAYISTIFVVMGVLRYLQVTLVDKKSFSPTRLMLTDRFLQITILLWVAFFAVLIYMK